MRYDIEKDTGNLTEFTAEDLRCSAGHIKAYSGYKCCEVVDSTNLHVDGEGIGLDFVDRFEC